MTAPVRIEAEAWSDLRFATLARILRLADSDHALIKVARIWSWQAEHYLPSKPTYVVDADTIESALGEGGALAMVRARLAEETPEGFRIKGTEGRIEWLYQRRQSSARGGEATRAKWKAGGEPEAGHPARECTPDNTTGPTGPSPGQPPGPVAARPNAGPLLPALVPDQRSELSLAPRAIHPADVVVIARSTWAAVSEARVRIAAELRIEGVIALPARFGMPSETRGCRDLRERVREEGDNAEVVCKHVVENLIAQANEERSVEWLSEKAFTPGGWQTARNWTPAKQQVPRHFAPRRAGEAIGAASPRTDHPDSPTLKHFSEL